ncbi:MAG: ABC transporter substrate binding protein [Gammaproteobacteria bacterium]|nr:ABC transporter substrate binding protein [Gammaproteobacteria bacterium]
MTRGILVLLCLLAGRVAAAPPLDIVVVTGEREVHQRILAATRETLEAGEVRARLHEASLATLDETLASLERPALVVTLGTQAATGLEHDLRVPILHAAIAESLYPRLLGSEQPGLHSAGHSALFLDQPVERQIAAIELALPRLQRLGVLASEEHEALLGPIAEAAQEAGIVVVDALVPEEGLLIPRVERLLRHADALLITPDPTIYNRYTLQKVLLAAYRQRKPVIGLSAAYVKAGALMAVHADPERIGADIGHSLAEFAERGELHPPSHARLYEISINHHVARSLGLNLPPEEALLEALRESEARR